MQLELRIINVLAIEKVLTVYDAWVYMFTSLLIPHQQQKYGITVFRPSFCIQTKWEMENRTHQIKTLLSKVENAFVRCDKSVYSSQNVIATKCRTSRQASKSENNNNKNNDDEPLATSH